MMTVIEITGCGPLQLVFCTVLRATINACTHMVVQLHESVIGWVVGRIVEAVVGAVHGAAVQVWR